MTFFSWIYIHFALNVTITAKPRSMTPTHQNKGKCKKCFCLVFFFVKNEFSLDVNSKSFVLSEASN